MEGAHSYKLVEQRRPAEQRKMTDCRNDQDFNYGYDKSHRVPSQERARWEAVQRNDRN